MVDGDGNKQEEREGLEKGREGEEALGLDVGYPKLSRRESSRNSASLDHFFFLTVGRSNLSRAGRQHGGRDVTGTGGTGRDGVSGRVCRGALTGMECGEVDV